MILPAPFHSYWVSGLANHLWQSTIFVVGVWLLTIVLLVSFLPGNHLLLGLFGDDCLYGGIQDQDYDDPLLHFYLALFQRNPFILDGGDNLLYVILPYLVLTNCGDYFSLDCR
jgi:hypothetical protein